MKRLGQTSVWLAVACLLVLACSGERRDTGDIEVDIDSRDVAADGSDCSDTGPPVLGCPCTGRLPLPGYCCHRFNYPWSGWQCPGAWQRYSNPGCDGDPATCTPCPLCPEEWEPEWESGVP